MEVAVITRHAIANYGSLLQAAATQNALEALGHNCRIIDYVRPGEVCTQLHKCQLQQKPRWNRTPLRRRVYGTLLYTENVMAGRLFESVRRQMLHLTAPYSTAQELTVNGPKADVYMTGSDQVWGPMEDGTYDPVYRLTFAPEGAKKVAYAASFGCTELSKPLRGQFCRDLRQYATITVREDSAIALLHQLGLEGKQVIDPVFCRMTLFGRACWNPSAQRPAATFWFIKCTKARRCAPTLRRRPRRQASRCCAFLPVCTKPPGAASLSTPPPPASSCTTSKMPPV